MIASLKRQLARRHLGDLVVKPRRPAHVRLFWIAVAIVGVIVVGGAIYNYGLSMAGFNSVSALAENARLKDELAGLRTENQDLRDGLARAQRAIQMDQAAYHDLDHSLQASAQEIMKLREDVNFYRNIISPADKTPGLRIQKLSVDPGGGEHQYYYKLMLIQALKQDRTIVGRVRFAIAGTQNDNSATVTIPGPSDKPIGVNFKYFQDIEGTFQLAPDFKPLRITVDVLGPNGQALVEHTYQWPGL